MDLPVRTNQIPRQVPEQPWFNNAALTIMVGGILPFGAVFVEVQYMYVSCENCEKSESCDMKNVCIWYTYAQVYYVLSSVWLHQFYYMFGFLFLVLVILFLTCAEVTIVV
jgi:transmembrane 9 superfamily member 2/4